MDYLLSIEKKVKKHLYPYLNPNFFSSFDQNIAHIWGLFCMNLNKHNAKNKNINFWIQNIMPNLAKIKKERLKNGIRITIRFHPRSIARQRMTKGSNP
jgi:hypothetical protein